MSEEPKVFDREEITHIANVKAKLESALSGAGVFDFMTFRINIDTEFEAISQILPKDQRDKIVIAGGAIASLINNEQFNDIDVFILNSDDLLFHSLIHFKRGKWDVRYQQDEDEKYYNPNIIATATNMESKVQYILTKFNNRQDMLKDFDFLHCTSSYHNGQLFINRETYDAIIKKQLIRQNKKKKSKIWRIEKFKNRGWKTEEDLMIENVPTTSQTLAKKLEDILKGNWPESGKTPRQMIVDDVKDAWNDILPESIKDEYLKSLYDMKVQPQAIENYPKITWKSHTGK